MKKINLMKLINKISEAYGKKVKKYEISFSSENNIYFELFFEEDERIMIRLWLNPNANNLSGSYKIILFNENIYTNKYITNDLDKFFEFKSKFFCSELYSSFGMCEIELDVKLRKHIEENIDKTIKRCFNRLKDVTKYNKDDIYLYLLYDAIYNAMSCRKFFEKYDAFNQNKELKSS